MARRWGQSLVSRSLILIGDRMIESSFVFEKQYVGRPRERNAKGKTKDWKRMVALVQRTE